MKALLLKSDGVFEFDTNHPTPDLSGEDVLVKVTAAGVCSSDIPRSFSNQSYFYPAILGHEVVGILNGKKVAVYPLISCTQCELCKIEDFHLCKNYNYIGSRRHGGFAEFVATPKQNVIDLPEHLE